MPDHDWRTEFDGVFQDIVESVQLRVWRAVYGKDVLDDVRHYSYLSRTDLDRCREELAVDAGASLGDLGCGQGGPGLEIAHRTGATLVGIDVSAVALETARATAAELHLAGRAEFRIGEFADTGLADDALDAALSVDALMFAPDKAAAVVEIARVLRPGGRLVLTTFDYHGQPAGRPAQLADHRPVLAGAGFEVSTYEETRDWHRRVSATTAGLLEAEAEIVAETGEDPEQLHEELLEMQATIAHMRRRVLVVARLA